MYTYAYTVYTYTHKYIYTYIYVSLSLSLALTRVGLRRLSLTSARKTRMPRVHQSTARVCPSFARSSGAK